MMDPRILTASGMKVEECVSDSLDLWAKPLVETQVESAYFVEVIPDVPLQDGNNTIMFRIPNSDDMTDLSGSFIQIRATIKKGDGSNLDAFALASVAAAQRNSVGFVNIPSTSMFSGMNFRINSELLSDSFQTYPYLSYFQNLLNYSRDAMESRLQLLGFYIDNDINSTDAHVDAVETGFKERATLTALSHEATFITNIFHGMFSQTKYLPALTPISLEFVKAPSAFCLTSNAQNPTFKYEIKSMKLFLRRIKVRASRKLAIEQKLAKEAAVYGIRQSYVKPFFIDAREKSVSFDNVFQSRTIPAFCIIAFCLQTNYRGNYATSPFKFENFSLTSLKMSIDNEVYPSPFPFRPNYTSTTAPDFTREYLALYQNEIKINSGSIIDLEMFKNGGYCMYAFDFGNEITLARDHTTPKRSGSCRLDVTFDSGSANAALCMLMYVEDDQQIAIDENRNVLRDFFV